jgi:hypothetical protein
VLSDDQGLTLFAKVLMTLGEHPEMFDLSNHRDYGDHDRWLNAFTEASARLDALQTAVTDLRHLLCHSEGVRSTEILEVLERHGV